MIGCSLKIKINEEGPDLMLDSLNPPLSSHSCSFFPFPPIPGSKVGQILLLRAFYWCWSWNSDTLATWCEELTHLKRPWCWERLKAGGKGDDRGWDDWIASLTRWTWVWANSGSWWWTGRPGVLQSMGSQRVGHDWEIQLNWEPFKSQGRRDYGDLMPSQIAKTHSPTLTTSLFGSLPLNEVYCDRSSYSLALSLPALLPYSLFPHGFVIM